MELNEKMLEKAKNAKTAEELVAIARENSIELTDEESKTYFAKLNAKEGEIDDDELDNVSGGACYSDDGYLMVTCGYSCSYFQKSVASDSNRAKCSCCMYWDKPWDDTGTEIGTWFGLPLRCVHPANRI